MYNRQDEHDNQLGGNSASRTSRYMTKRVNMTIKNRYKSGQDKHDNQLGKEFFQKEQVSYNLLEHKGEEKQDKERQDKYNKHIVYAQNEKINNAGLHKHNQQDEQSKKDQDNVTTRANRART